MTWVAGVDGCPAGWFVVFYDVNTGVMKSQICSSFRSVISHDLAPEIIAVDTPIGLLAAAERGGRDCDRCARKYLGKQRQSSVFSAPVRSAIDKENYMDALQANRASSSERIGISKQCFCIIPKIREVDKIITSRIQEKVKEVHPELCFCRMTGGKPTIFSKSKQKQKAIDERTRALASTFLGSVLDDLMSIQTSPSRVERHDILDAAAACWTARRIMEGHAERIPERPDTDARNLAMEMWI